MQAKRSIVHNMYETKSLQKPIEEEFLNGWHEDEDIQDQSKLVKPVCKTMETSNVLPIDTACKTEFQTNERHNSEQRLNEAKKT